MTWRDTLRRVTLADGRRLIGASFRGVPFFVEATDRSGGRRLVVDEFPKRDPNFNQDMGRRARGFRVDGYVIGDDYVLQRDTLLTALEDVSGPGELVHPSHGVRRVSCASFTTRETVAEGGMATISIEFTEAPVQAVTPTEAPDRPGVVSASANSTNVTTQAEFVATYNTGGLPAFALGSAETAITSMAEGLRTSMSKVLRATQELAELNGQLHLIAAEASSLVRDPAGILSAFVDAIATVADTAASAPGDILGALLEAYAVDLGPEPPIITATRQRERDNQAALFAALRRLLVTEAARLAPMVTFKTIEEATAVRYDLAAKLEEQAATAGDDAYLALVTLRADLVRSVPSDDVFTRVITVERRVSLPCLLLAFQLYGSVDQEADLIARNGTSHPGFMSGTLRALSNG